ncbi:HepT-like ribonuclease domain-containing protein [Blastococcus jejuensis]|uniref:HepT-like ribonuclease domain-containing protein n=1 Tax=Blastococcus jejuensis TaxID=351224 RepID=UPI0031DC13A8
MSRHERQRLLDVQAALDAIDAHVDRGELSDGLVFDAVRVRLIEIGEAVKSLPRELLDSEPGLPWTEIARMRDQLAHRYFDTTHAIVASTVSHDLPQLRRAVARLLDIAADD